MMGDTTVSVLVLNYNGLDHLGPCFDSLLAQDFPADRLQLILVDNQSSDNSVAFVRERYPTVKVIEHGENLGFAAGYDRAAPLADGDYLAFLNNDTRVARNWLAELLRPCLEDPTVVCTASLMLDWDGKRLDFAGSAINFIGWGFQLRYGEAYCPETLAPKDLFFACGGAMLIERRAFLDAGGFDPGYFAYFEDVDLGWRLQLRGYRTVFAPKAIVFHRHHGTARALNSVQRWALLERNALQSVLKNYEDAHLVAILPAALLLLWERAYLDLLPAPAPAAGPAVDGPFGPGYYLSQLAGLLKGGAYRELGERARAEWRRRRPRLRPEVPEAARCLKVEPAAVTQEMALTAAGRLLAGQALLECWPELKRRRAEVQAARRVPDSRIFPLFGRPLTSNFCDERFMQVMNSATWRFGIRQMFDADGDGYCPAAAGLDKSWAVSHKMLEIMAQALALSGVEPGSFQLGGARLPEISQLSESTIYVLGEMDAIARSLPEASTSELLEWLDGRCSELLSLARSMAVTHQGTGEQLMEQEDSPVLRHAAGSYLDAGPLGPVVHTAASGGVALDDMLCRLWQWADGRTVAQLEQIPLFARQRMLRSKILALRAAGLLLPPLASVPPSETKSSAPAADSLVSVIIVSRNGRHHLEECLPSIAAQTHPAIEVILVDEQSGDGTQSYVKEHYPEVKVLEQTGPANFAAGCNLGARHGSGQWLLFLNNDTRLEPSCIAELLAAQQGERNVGGVAAMLRFYANPGFVNGLGNYVRPVGHGYDLGIGSLDVGQYERQREVALLCFGAALIPRSAWERVGPLDEAYGFYSEDADWSYRARAMGLRLIAAPRARVYHKFGASMDGLPSSFKVRLTTRNRLRFAARNLPLRAALRQVAANTVADGAEALRWLRTGHPELASAACRGWLEFCAAAPACFVPRPGQVRRDLSGELDAIASRFPPPQLMGAFPLLTEAAVESTYSEYLDRLTKGDDARPRLLIISPDIVRSSMGGVGMRYWELAGQLSRVASVTLATPGRTDLTPDAFKLKSYIEGDQATLAPLVDEADVVLLSGFVVHHHPFLRGIKQRIIVDLYDPTVLENLARFASKPVDEQNGPHVTGVMTYNDLFCLGDFFVCATEKQRDFWLGGLTSANRVNPTSYAADPTLRRLIDVVPFGLPADPPTHQRPVLKGVVQGIGEHDKVILWGGGLWDWLDPLTAIDAMPAVLAAVPEARLFFMGTRHPNPEVPPSLMARAAIQRAEELGLKDRAVFFNDWVPYAERANYLTEADLGISLHGDHIETRFAIRTRVMDYLWASLPMVISGGDAISELVQNQGLGAIVEPGDVAGVTNAIISLLQCPVNATCFAAVREAYCWPQAARPLVTYLQQQPQRLSRPQAETTPVAAPRPYSDGLLSKAYRAARRGGLAGLSKDVRSYITWRLSRL